MSGAPEPAKIDGRGTGSAEGIPMAPARLTPAPRLANPETRGGPALVWRAGAPLAWGRRSENRARGGVGGGKRWVQKISRPPHTQVSTSRPRPHGSSGQGSLWPLQSSPKSSFRVLTRSDDSAHPHARATPHRPRLPGLTGPIAACEDGHPACYRHGINEPSQRRPTWHLASSRCCAGDGPEFLATMAAVMKMSLRRSRWLVLCRRALRSARCSSKDAEIVSARARQRENNEVAPHRPRTALGADGCC